MSIGTGIPFVGVEVPVTYINLPLVLLEREYAVRPQTGDGKSRRHSTLGKRLLRKNSEPEEEGYSK